MVIKINIDFSKNLERKQSLIDKLKELVNSDVKMSEKYSQFKKIQEEWFKIGPVPRTNRSIIWNNFQHHIKNFYDYLHLNRKFKKIDIQYNNEKKESLIKKASELIKYNNPTKSYKDFQRVLKKWKFEIGPTTKDSDLKFNKRLEKIEKEILINKENFESNKESILQDNLIKKNKLLEKIKIINEKECNESWEWKKKIIEFEKIKELIENSGPIPLKEKKLFWKNYKELIRIFYKSKNIFFKKLKSIYKENITKQEDLIKKIENLNSSQSIDKKKKEIIEIQKSWKKIKPVPYKVNKKNYLKFRELSNKTYNKVSEEILQKSKENKEVKERQIEFIKEISNTKFEGEVDISNFFKKWNEFGPSENEMVVRFENTIIQILKKSGIKEDEADMCLFDKKLNYMSPKKKSSEIANFKKEINNLKGEYSKLTNNLSFFNEKSKENELLKKVHIKIKNIEIKIKNIETKIIKLKT